MPQGHGNERNGTSKRGFASMDPERQREIARKGGASVPSEKRSFSQDRTMAADYANVAAAETLGYRRALVYDSPAFLADPWVTLTLAAARTSRIKLGVSAITPRLRHVVATAGALATLHAHAPGRVEAVIGAGFTAQLMLGKKPVSWAEVERYTVALKALLAGHEIDWDGAVTGLKPSLR